MDSIADNFDVIFYAGAAIVLFVIGLIFFAVRGRKGISGPVDPLAEADVYLAYGRSAQAKELLQEALRADPRREDIAAKLRELENKR